MVEDGPRTSVLVVDDEKEVADAYALTLRDRYEVTIAYDGTAALEAIDDEIDVVLLDRRMPELSGDEVLSRIRDRDLPVNVIMLTAIDPDFDIIGMPFDDYICKPVSDEDLYEAIEQQVRIQAYERLGEYFRLEAKRAILRSQLPGIELDDHDEYTELKARTADLRQEIATAVPEFDELAESFEEIGRET